MTKKSLSAKARLVDEWNEIDKKSLNVEHAAELAGEYEKSISWLLSLYRVHLNSPDSETKIEADGQINKTHCYHSKFLDGVLERLTITASQGRIHHSGYERLLSENALDASWLMNQAIERKDASSAAFMSFVFTVTVLAINDDEVNDFLMSLGGHKSISEQGRNNRKGRTGKKQALLAGLRSVVKSMDTIPSAEVLRKWLSRRPDGFQTKEQLCPEIFLDRVDGKLHIKFMYRNSFSEDLKDGSISLDTYRRDYIPELKAQKNKVL